MSDLMNNIVWGITITFTVIFLIPMVLGFFWMLQDMYKHRNDDKQEAPPKSISEETLESRIPFD
jgi:hypothetical protein